MPLEDYEKQTRPIDHPYSMHLLAEQGSSLVLDLLGKCRQRILNWPPSAKTWGYTGPALLTDTVNRNLDRVDRPPFPTLCGFEGSYIWQWYLGVEDVPAEARVLHLFSSAYPELFWEGRADVWLERYPQFELYERDLPTWPYCRGAIPEVPA